MMDRNKLDAFVAQHKLGREAVDAALEISRARPTSNELWRFAISLLRLAGALSIAAGIVFFVAANWEEIDVLARFGLVEALLVASAGVALWRPPPNALGRGALLFAFVMAGALLALFGQTYQTGANVYELFLTWSVLGLPLVIAAQWSVSWSAWALVLNVALGLFCSLRPEGGWFWFLLSGTRLDAAELLLAPMMVNLSLWGLREYIEETRWSAIAPPWLGRLVLACAVGYGTWAGAIVILGENGNTGADALALLFVIIAFLCVAAYAIRERADVFPLAALAGSAIVLTTTALATAVEMDDEVIFFLLSIWLIASSTVSGRLLMKLVRLWAREAEA